ncbi:MAG: GIY-YIG nuclease family protein [Rhodospirillaceae bacterium]
MAAPFTIKIFVADGDPDGVRIISRMNWTGQGMVFPRERWPETKSRQDFDFPGVYILVGPAPDDDLPKVYVGEGDCIRDRLESHCKNKDFWAWAIAFVSTNQGLNKAHVQWLEFALVGKAKQAGRCHLDNGNTPLEPKLTESEKADTVAFLNEILQILPLVGLRVFEPARAISPSQTQPVGQKASQHLVSGPDTIIVPAEPEGFNEVFIGQNCWYSVRISGGMLQKIKWIAGYQTKPVSAITHVAPVSHIEPYGDGGKFRIVFSEPAKTIAAIPYADAPGGSLQGPRYTTYSKLMAAKKLTDIVGKG